MEKKRPLILITNDDGITAPGIRTLIEVMRHFGNVVVVAPDKPQSGMGHAITVNDTLRVPEVTIDSSTKGYACTGTPVDCVKLAVNKILKQTPDLIVSGINHGNNSSINVLYSGTMSAAIEGAMEGIPSIGFSLLNHSINADFTASKKYVHIITKNVLEKGLPKGVCLNVNIPYLKENEIMGIKVCRQANANWKERFDTRIDPFGKEYFWLTGEFINYDNGKDTDVCALEDNYVSIVPIQFDLTAHTAIKDISSWNWMDE